ncbi:MAG: hypothetical protein DDT30_00579 [Dehalococcoidia bacterium]|nr:hypothetical protein [Bacillota bacterium]MBT9142011.1 hypothetical protein [Bacillota bacterium]
MHPTCDFLNLRRGGGRVVLSISIRLALALITSVIERTAYILDLKTRRLRFLRHMALRTKLLAKRRRIQCVGLVVASNLAGGLFNDFCRLCL